MPDTKITALTAIGANPIIPSTFPIPMVDLTDTSMAASGTTKKVTVNQILGAGGTATLASATITGNLTVQSNVNAPANVSLRYGPSAATWAGLRFDGTNQTFLDSDIGISFRTGGATSFTTAYQIGATGISTWSVAGTTAMTLNSTGLGVGVSPSYQIHARKDQAAFTTVAVDNQNAIAAGTGTQFLLIDGGVNAGWFRRNRDGSGNTDIGYKDTLRFRGQIAGTERTDLMIDSSGNVGIGVTPSAWTTYYALQIRNGSIANYSPTQDLRISSNAYYASGVWKRIAAAYATQYLQDGSSGIHQWFVAATGAADSTITTFSSAAMTLDAVSSLHVNTTAYTGVAAGFVNALNGYNIVQNNTGSASNRNWQLATNGSSAGVLDFTVSSANNTFPNFAYRMQLTSAGAAYNTTGTWGTISDSRLKENISDARNYLSDLLKLRVVKYSLKEEASAVATKLGLIAQEVEQVFPSLVEQSDVAYEGGDGIRTVKTSILVPMLLKAIQELTARVQTLETR